MGVKQYIFRMHINKTKKVEECLVQTEVPLLNDKEAEPDTSSNLFPQNITRLLSQNTQYVLTLISTGSKY